jgi:hypothetical protein
MSHEVGVALVVEAVDDLSFLRSDVQFEPRRVRRRAGRDGRHHGHLQPDAGTREGRLRKRIGQSELGFRGEGRCCNGEGIHVASRWNERVHRRRTMEVDADEVPAEGGQVPAHQLVEVLVKF